MISYCKLYRDLSSRKTMNITKRLRKYIEATFFKLSHLPTLRESHFSTRIFTRAHVFVCSVLPKENKGIPVVLVFAEDVAVSRTWHISVVNFNCHFIIWRLLYIYGIAFTHLKNMRGNASGLFRWCVYV